MRRERRVLLNGEVIPDCRENAGPAQRSPARFVTTATDARIIMQTSAPNENHMKVKAMNTHTHKIVQHSSGPPDNCHNSLFHL